MVWLVRGGGPTSLSATHPVRLAVLPYGNTGSTGHAAVTEGIADVLTAKLSALPGLAVIDRRSAGYYHATTKTATQIGAELGVALLVQGVVRWEKNAGGAWTALVTTSLVDAKSGKPTWTGQPVVLTPTDPFKVEGVIATQIAEALRIEMHDEERANLARAFAGSVEAFTAYQRGVALTDSAARRGITRAGALRVYDEFQQAVTLDTAFAEAWVRLAGASGVVALMSPGDSRAEEERKATLARVAAHANGRPRLQFILAQQRMFFEHDTTAVDALMEEAFVRWPHDADVLSFASGLLVDRQEIDSAYALAKHVLALDPRSSANVIAAVNLAALLHRFREMRRHAEALIALDSTDERGWTLLVGGARLMGDTMSMQRELAAALKQLPHPSHVLLRNMAYAGGGYDLRYVALSARDLAITTLWDSVDTYYGNKTDVFLRRRDVAKSRVYSDSIRALLLRRSLAGPQEAMLLSALAFAQAHLGLNDDARRTLARMRNLESREDGSGDFDPMMLAAAYAQLGESEAAVAWLEKGALRSGPWTAGAYLAEPKLLPLHDTPSFTEFLQKHAE